MIISGRVSIKMAPVVRRLLYQMLEPKWAIAMGACSSSMGVFNNYAIVPADKFLPVDIHVPGCPPRPEALVYAILKLRAMVMSKPDQGWRSRTAAAAPRSSSPRCWRRHQRGQRRGRHGQDGFGALRDGPGADRPGVARAQRGSVLDTVYFRDKAALTVAAARSARRWRTCAAGLQLPGLRPRRRLLARGAAPRRALRAPRHVRGRPHDGQGPASPYDAPNVPSVVEAWPTADATDHLAGRRLRRYQN